MRAFIGIVAGVSIFMICAGSVGAQSIPGIGYRAGAGSGPVSGAAGGGSVVGAEGLERCCNDPPFSAQVRPLKHTP